MTRGAKAGAPNILIIMADQLAPQALPVYGHSLVKAPHIRKLAEEGVVFENAYCNFPLCGPARMSMLTGRFAHKIACWDNGAELPAAVPTMAHYMRSVGYNAILAGKMHYIGPDQLHGYCERVTTDIYPSNFAWTPDWITGDRDRPTKRNTMHSVVDAGVCVRSLQIDYDEEVERASLQKLYDLVRFSEDPFFITISFTHPHDPFVTTQKYWDLYDQEEIDMPAVPAIPVEELDEMSRRIHYAHAADKHIINDERLRTARRAYYGMCSYIDDKVGRIINTMKEIGAFENTILIFTADHGEMLGERGMWYKQCFFEWSARVPIIIYYPKEFEPRRVSQLVSLVDLLPTLMDLATGGNAPDPVSPLDGNSMVELMNGNVGGWDDTVISEYTGNELTSPCRMIRRGRYKYIYTHGYPPVMYDLESDPLELDNLVGTAKHASRENELLSDLLDGWDPDAITAKCLQSQKERLFIQKTTGGEPNWAFRFRIDDDTRFIRNADSGETEGKARYPFIQPTAFDR